MTFHLHPHLFLHFMWDRCRWPVVSKQPGLASLRQTVPYLYVSPSSSLSFFCLFSLFVSLFVALNLYLSPFLSPHLSQVLEHFHQPPLRFIFRGTFTLIHILHTHPSSLLNTCQFHVYPLPCFSLIVIQLSLFLFCSALWLYTYNAASSFPSHRTPNRMLMHQLRVYVTGFSVLRQPLRQHTCSWCQLCFTNTD